MAATLEIESTLTDRYQTTVPESVRRVLKLGKRDKIHYSILPDGEVLLTRAEPKEEEDPAIASFLDFLARDIADHPENLRTIPQELINRIDRLVGDIDVDLDAPLPPEE